MLTSLEHVRLCLETVVGYVEEEIDKQVGVNHISHLCVLENV